MKTRKCLRFSEFSFVPAKRECFVVVVVVVFFFKRWWGELVSEVMLGEPTCIFHRDAHLSARFGAHPRWARERESLSSAACVQVSSRAGGPSQCSEHNACRQRVPMSPSARHTPHARTAPAAGDTSPARPTGVVAGRRRLSAGSPPRRAVPLYRQKWVVDPMPIRYRQIRR